MRNVKTSISNHNHQLLKQRAESPTNCNCRLPNECPLNGKCLTENLVYKAEITTTNVEETKIYRNDIRHIQKALCQPQEII